MIEFFIKKFISMRFCENDKKTLLYFLEIFFN